jgi:hypothetical protein
MSLRKALLLFSLMVTTVCLAGGYTLVGSWIGAGLAFLPPLAMLFYKKLLAPWLPPAFLCSAVCLAGAGLFEGTAPFLMILGVIAALAAWDLVNLDRLLAKSASSQAIEAIERAHLRSLALALSLGVILAGSGLLLTLQVPFIWLFLLVAFDVFALDRVYRLVNGRRA